jgi:hypothetical protein
MHVFLVYKVYTDPCEIGLLWCNIAQWVQFKNDFRDGWGVREIKTTKVQYGGVIYLV